jgi:WD40 repeat protein
VDVETGQVRRPSRGVLSGAPTWIVFSPDGVTIVSTSLDGAVTLWDPTSATPVQTLRAHTDSAHQAVFSPDGETLYAVGHDGKAFAWDMSGARGLDTRFRFTSDGAFDAYDRHPARFSPDGRLIATSLEDRGIALRDADTLTPLGERLVNTGGPVKALAFTPDGRTLGAVTQNGLATLWDVALRSLIHGPFAITPEGEPEIGASFSADGTLFATTSPDGAMLWDTATGSALGSVGAGSIGDVAFSPVGTAFAFVHADSAIAEVWDTARRARLATLQPPPTDDASQDLGYAVAFSPDGRTVASSGLGHPLLGWDVPTQTLVRELEQGGAGVLTLDFGPDGTLLAVSGWEPVAALWDVPTATRIGPTLKAGDRRAQVDVSPDGRRLLLTHGDGQGAVWDIDPESWKQRACSIANRTLTPEEWARFLPNRPYEPACT